MALRALLSSEPAARRVFAARPRRVGLGQGLDDPDGVAACAGGHRHVLELGGIANAGDLEAGGDQLALGLGDAAPV